MSLTNRIPVTNTFVVFFNGEQNQIHRICLRCLFSLLSVIWNSSSEFCHLLFCLVRRTKVAEGNDGEKKYGRRLCKFLQREFIFEKLTFVFWVGVHITWASGSAEVFVPLPPTKGKGQCSYECSPGKEELDVVLKFSWSCSTQHLVVIVLGEMVISMMTNVWAVIDSRDNVLSPAKSSTCQ